MVVLTAQDRCDGCSARAAHVVQKPQQDTVLELYLCGHHANRHESALLSSGWIIITDMSDTEPVSVPALTE